MHSKKYKIAKSGFSGFLTLVELRGISRDQQPN